jgi:flagellin
MRGQVRGLNMAGKNIQDAIAVIQTAEGAMHEIHEMLQRARELAVQAINDTNIEDDRKIIQDEVSQLLEEIESISERTEYNNMKLLRGGGSIAPRGPGGGTLGLMLTGDALTQPQQAFTFTQRLENSILEKTERMVATDFGLTISNRRCHLIT